ncbi:MAG: diguanylate cyclase [bacterium]
MIHQKILIASNSLVSKKIIKNALESSCMLLFVPQNNSLVASINMHQPLSCIIIDLAHITSKTMQSISTLKTHFSTYHIPLILLTNKITTASIIQATQIGVDDYIIKPLTTLQLQQRVAINLGRAKRNQSINPLTLLPGNAIINNTILKRLSHPFALMYVDLDNFKTYNDTYGFSMGDQLIKYTATLLSSCIKKYGNNNDFVGHIGGDDFIIITTPEKTQQIAQEICAQFDRNLPEFYKIFQGSPNQHPPITLSIAIITNNKKKLTSVSDVAQQAAYVKHHAKKLSHHKSNYIID